MAQEPKRDLFQELKTRSVFRVAAMYLVVGWVLLQFIDVVAEPLALPDWFGRILIVGLILGFPIALCLAWLFDVTPRGLVRAADSQYTETDRLQFARKVDLVIIGFLGLALALTIFAYENRAELGASEPVSSPQMGTDDETVASFNAARPAPVAATGQYLLVGNLVDFTGTTATSGLAFGQAVIDSANWINESGGINGKLIDLDTVETSYLVRRALAAYRKWQAQGVLAIQGWGTQIGQAMTDPVASDRVPFFSASYAGTFTDPDVAPYNFFYGPSYSDGCRGLLEWAKNDWAQRQGSTAPTYVHVGDNHPYPNAPKKACEAYAEELGFVVLPAIVVALVPEDFTRQCETLATSQADYAFLANTDKSVIALLTRCHALDVDTQFMANIWGFDEQVMKAAGEAADGVVWVMGAAQWGDEETGMYTVREISRMSDPEENKYRSVHYVRGICSMFYLKEAMEWADLHGGITGQNIRRGMYQRQGWVPAGLEGVCLPATWTEDDHRGVTTVMVYRGQVKGDVDGPIDELISRGIITMERVYTVEIPRRPAWLGS